MSRKSILFVLALNLFPITPLFAQTIVVPPQFENQPGIPSESFFLCSILTNGLRIQSIYPADDLIAGTIGEFSIRTLEGFPSFGPFAVANITVIMSTTDAEPGELSDVFADNTGPDAQTVFSGDLNIGFIPVCNTNPCPFNIPVTFQTPFQYDPSEGNLLLDMRVPPCLASIPPFILIDSTSELSAIIATDSNAAEGSEGIWNITQFVYTERLATVPTVSEWGLLAMVAGLGLIGFFVAHRRKTAA